LKKEKNEIVEQHHNRFLQTIQDFIEVCPILKIKIFLLNKESNHNINVKTVKKNLMILK